MHLLDKFLFGLIFSSAWVQIYAIPQFLNTINQANQVFQAGNLDTATTLFIQGYWDFRNTFTKIWHDVDPIGSQKPLWGWYKVSFNGIPVNLSPGKRANRGYTPMSNIWLGCWLNNSLLHQKVAYWHDCFCVYFDGSYISCDKKSKSNVIKKKLLEKFEDKQRFKCLRDVGNWLQKDFCDPVSQVLLEHFRILPQSAHELLQILELYKCYIECDCGDIYQIRFAQANYNDVYNAFYLWFADVVKTQLNNPTDNDLHAALITIVFHWNEQKSDFTDKKTLPDETIRGLGGYQIEAVPFFKCIRDPNFLSGVEVKGKKAKMLLKEINAVKIER